MACQGRWEISPNRYDTSCRGVLIPFNTADRARLLLNSKIYRVEYGCTCSVKTGG